MVSSNIHVNRTDTIDESLAVSDQGGCVLALADSYPTPRIEIDKNHIAEAERKDLRFYIEYPKQLGGMDMGPPRVMVWERCVISTDFFDPYLKPDTIIMPHGCWYATLDRSCTAHIVAGRIAGYRRAVYGMADVEAVPILSEYQSPNILIAATPLSNCIVGRYAPYAAWRDLWRSLLGRLSGFGGELHFDWRPTAGPGYCAGIDLPDGYQSLAFDRSAKWFKSSAVYSVDRKKGVIEGYESSIDFQGRQKLRPILRSDCIAESAMVMAIHGSSSGDPGSNQLASDILDYVWTSPDFAQNDETSPAYGLVNWYERGPIFYGDDDARVLLATIAARRMLSTDRWDEHLLRCLLSNLRTTGTQGFRRNRIDLEDFHEEERNWTFFKNEEYVRFSPHYQAYLWACFLWGYAATGYEEFLNGTLNAVEMCMDAYPNWQWTNQLTSEMARILLPLSFLVRITGDKRHLSWLEGVCSDLLSHQQPSGAIREYLGSLEGASYPPPRSNSEYGVREASIIQGNGDPCADLLYTTAFAYLGLHEASLATQSRELTAAVTKLEEFLCRIQVVSQEHPYLDGSWMRGFDFDLWEYYGSSADVGWGAWSVESGWVNTWISTVLGLRMRNESLFDLWNTASLTAMLPEMSRRMSTIHPVNPDLAPTIRWLVKGKMPGSE